MPLVPVITHCRSHKEIQGRSSIVFVFFNVVFKSENIYKLLERERLAVQQLGVKLYKKLYNVRLKTLRRLRSHTIRNVGRSVKRAAFSVTKASAIAAEDRA